MLPHASTHLPHIRSAPGNSQTCVYQSEGVSSQQDIWSLRVFALLVAGGCGGCWLIVADIVGITPRSFQVDILARVLSS